VRFVLALASIIAADSGPSEIVVAVNESVQRDVGYLIGFRCDDPTVLAGEMKTVDDTNYFVITGKKVGATTCRVGTDPLLPSIVFNIRVLPAQRH
jgi:hypothetical protein